MFLLKKTEKTSKSKWIFSHFKSMQSYVESKLKIFKPADSKMPHHTTFLRSLAGLLYHVIYNEGYRNLKSSAHEAPYYRKLENI